MGIIAAVFIAVVFYHNVTWGWALTAIGMFIIAGLQGGENEKLKRLLRKRMDSEDALNLQLAQVKSNYQRRARELENAIEQLYQGGASLPERDALELLKLRQKTNALELENTRLKKDAEKLKSLGTPEEIRRAFLAAKSVFEENERLRRSQPSGFSDTAWDDVLLVVSQANQQQNFLTASEAAQRKVLATYIGQLQARRAPETLMLTHAMKVVRAIAPQRAA